MHEITDPHAPANVLAALVRSLSIVFGPEHGAVELSHRRGGASVLIELMERCSALEALVVRPMFLKSSTCALSGLQRSQCILMLSVFQQTVPRRPSQA